MRTTVPTMVIAPEMICIGMISEAFNPSKADNCTYYEVAKDGIAVIVNKENTFDNISLEDLKNIYNVEAGDAAIKTWAGVSK